MYDETQEREYWYFYGSINFEREELLYDIDDQFYKGLKRVKNVRL